MIDKFTVENQMVIGAYADPTPPRPKYRDPDNDVFEICEYCGDPIRYDTRSWESEYMDTEDGIMHTCCALDWFREQIQAYGKTAHREREEEDETEWE